MKKKSEHLLAIEKHRKDKLKELGNERRKYEKEIEKKLRESDKARRLC